MLEKYSGPWFRVTRDRVEKGEYFKSGKFPVGAWCSVRTKTRRGAQNWRQFAENESRIFLNKRRNKSNASLLNNKVAQSETYSRMDLNVLLFLNIQLCRKSPARVGGRLMWGRQVFDLTTRQAMLKYSYWPHLEVISVDARDIFSNNSYLSACLI